MRGVNLRTGYKVLAVMLFVALSTLSYFGVLLEHSSDGNMREAACSSACHSHGEAASINGGNNMSEEVEKEPIPPLATRFEVSVNLWLLYVLPVFGVLWFASFRNKIHLTTQLRL